MADGTSLLPEVQGSSNASPAGALRGALPAGRRLLDTDSLTINLGFGGNSIYCRGITPYVTLSGPDGEVEFVGLADMRAARDALVRACKIAEAQS